MRLNLKPGPERYELAPGIAIIARPALSEVIEEAKGDDSLFAYAEEMRELVGDSDEKGEVTAAMIRSRGKVGLIFAKAVARAVIEEWEGVEDPDGSPAPVSGDRVDAFLDVPALYNAFTEVYLGRWLTVQAEKNDSAPSQNGTSAAAQTTAVPAPSDAETAPRGSKSRKR